MRTKWILAACGASGAILLAGCSGGDGVGPWSPPEARINAAFPLSESLRNNRAWLLEAVTGAQQKDMAARLESRVKLRALNCAQGYTPSLFTGSDGIRKKLGGTTCFAETDIELTRWTGLLRVGIVLAQPPLKEVPKAIPGALVADGFISGAMFASAAPTALLDVGPGQGVQVLDIETSRVLFREAGAGRIGPLSPNGRLFIVGDNDRLRIRESETGATVAELPSARYFSFHWLDGRTAIFNRIVNGAERPFLIDFASGKELAIPWLPGGMQRAVSVRDVDNQYVVFAGTNITKISLDRGGLEPVVSLVADKPVSGTSWALNTSGATADGTRYFSASFNTLQIVNLATLEVDSVGLEPFNLQLSFPTPDPDKIVVTGFVPPSQGEGPRELVYSISRRALAPLDTAQLKSRRLVYLPALKKQGLINDRKIELVDALPTLEEIPIAQFAAQLQDIANQRKLAQFEKQQQVSNAAGGYPQQAYVGNAPLADLARNAQVEAVGVYQGGPGAPQAPGARRTGYVEVRVRAAAKPIVLVLSSYEPVRWMLITERGAQLAAVLVSGYHASQVVGAGNARVINTGSAYAYKMDGNEYQALNRDVARLIGKSIGLFQGRYEGGQFSVGGL